MTLITKSLFSDPAPYPWLDSCNKETYRESSFEQDSYSDLYSWVDPAAHDQYFDPALEPWLNPWIHT